MARRIPKYVRPMVPKQQQRDARHTALSELELARQTSALAVRCGQNSHHFVYAIPDSAPTCSLTAVQTFNNFDIASSVQFEIPFFFSSGFDSFIVAATFVSTYTGPIITRVRTDGMPAGGGGPVTIGYTRSTYWQDLREATWSSLNVTNIRPWKYTTAQLEVREQVAPVTSNFRLAIDIAIDNAYEPIFDNSGSILFYLKSAFVYEVPAREDA